MRSTQRGGIHVAITPFETPYDVVAHPQLEPEVKRAILASRASDAHAVESRPALRRPPEVRGPVAVDDVLAALRSLDNPNDASTATGERGGRPAGSKRRNRRLLH
jgi:hypothetical protein